MRDLFVALASCLAAAGAELRVLSGPHAGLVVETAEFTNYSPRGAKVTALAIFLDGDDLCYPKALDVRGKIVISATNKRGCNVLDAYRLLAEAGALAFVKDSFYKPPGLSSGARDYWGSEKPGLSTLLVDVSSQDVTLHELKHETLSIAPPHNSQYSKMFASAWWTIFHQTLIPLFGALIVVKAFAESWRQKCLMRDDAANGIRHAKHSPKAQCREVGRMVCVIEGVCVFLLSLSHASGMWGPTALPHWCYSFFWTALTGQSLFTTLLLSCFMTERLRALNQSWESSAPRPIFVTYRTRLLTGGSVCVGLDLILGVVRLASWDYSPWSAALYGLASVFYLTSIGIFGGMFALAAYRVSKPMIEVRHHREARNLPKRLDMERIVNVLFYNGLAKIGAFLAYAWWLVEVVRGIDSVERYSVYVWCFVTARLAVAFWHIEAFRPALGASSFAFLSAELKRSLGKKVEFRVTPYPAVISGAAVQLDSIIHSSDTPPILPADRVFAKAPPAAVSLDPDMDAPTGDQSATQP